MAGLIAKQICKKLGMFFHNFTEDNIKLEILKGEAEIHNIGPCLVCSLLFLTRCLALNEAVFQELLSLPPNLLIKAAFCNHLIAKVSFLLLLFVD